MVSQAPIIAQLIDPDLILIALVMNFPRNRE
jgi:hypothetical protein